MKRIIFSAAWCAQCTALKESLRTAQIDFDEVNVDTDEGAAVAQQNAVRGLPTTLIFQGEELIKTIVGLKPVSEYL